MAFPAKTPFLEVQCRSLAHGRPIRNLNGDYCATSECDLHGPWKRAVFMGFRGIGMCPERTTSALGPELKTGDTTASPTERNPTVFRGTTWLFNREFIPN